MRTLLLRGDDGPTFTARTDRGPVAVQEPPWLAFIVEALDCPPLVGQHRLFTPAEMAKRLRVTKVIERGPRAGSLARIHEDGSALTLEDGDMKTLAAAVEGMPWARGTEWILDFIHAVQAAAADDKEWQVKMRAAAEWPKPPDPADAVAEAELAAKE